jgi:hypothetical protein
MDRRAFVAACLGGASGLAIASACRLRPQASGETLYNGIVLPREWPPRRVLTTKAAMPPYLIDPPTVIPIDVGRQLFVDDFLIERTTLQRVWHRPAYYEGNPIIAPDRPWEQPKDSEDTDSAAMVFSDGVFWDPAAGAFRMWYMSGYRRATSCAISSDGIHWTKPVLDVVPGTNIVLNEGRDSTTIWRDPFDSNPAARFKMTLFSGNPITPLKLFDSPDGVHWTFRGKSGLTGDRTTFFYNPFRKRWVYSLRANLTPQGGRYRKYLEAKQFVSGAAWTDADPVPWVAADELDRPRPEMIGTQPEIYALDCVAYESVLLGLFSIWRGDVLGRDKFNDVFTGFSRDGYHWTRLDRSPFLPMSDRKGDWNYGNVQTAGGCCTIVGDRLHFYVSGRSGVADTLQAGRCATGLASLRRDGFCSMDPGPAPTAGPGALTTRRVRFSGRALFVNADPRGGELRVEILDMLGRPIEQYSRDAAVPIRTDGTRHLVRWKTTDDVGALRDRIVQLRFFLSNGSIFSFWVSPSPEGRSRGYVAGGGPDFVGAIDG